MSLFTVAYLIGNFIYFVFWGILKLNVNGAVEIPIM